MTRHLLRWLACGLVGVLLVAQMAVAGYVCPRLSPLSASTSSDEQPAPDAGLPMARMAQMAQMADCDGMAGALDATSANLCAEHCKYGQQSDHAPTLNAPAAVFTALYLRPPVCAAEPPSRPAAATLSARVAASPPHAILHCVHRI